MHIVESHNESIDRQESPCLQAGQEVLGPDGVKQETTEVGLDERGELFGWWVIPCSLRPAQERACKSSVS